MREGLDIGTMHFEEYVKAFFIICLNEWNLWMCSVLFLYINGIWECFLYWSFIWMGYVNVFFNVCWLNGIYECFLYRVLIWMESVNVSILFLDMNGFCKGVLYYVYMNGICESVLYCLLIWMESMNAFFTLSVFEYLLLILKESWNVLFIVCLEEWNLWMFPSLFAKMNGICKCVLYCLVICISLLFWKGHWWRFVA
jgi:hypothetical protein